MKHEDKQKAITYLDEFIDLYRVEEGRLRTLALAEGLDHKLARQALNDAEGCVELQNRLVHVRAVVSETLQSRARRKPSAPA